jgi:hypothetical protein
MLAVGSGNYSRLSSPQRRIGNFRMMRDTFAELLIDCEEDRTLRAALVGMLRDDRMRSNITTEFVSTTVSRSATEREVPA